MESKADPCGGIELGASDINSQSVWYPPVGIVISMITKLRLTPEIYTIQ